MSSQALELELRMPLHAEKKGLPRMPEGLDDSIFAPGLEKKLRSQGPGSLVMMTFEPLGTHFPVTT